jgi:ribosomal protein S6
MAENNMPAAEATRGVYTDEVRSYELAFHILPTVAEGEVTGAFDVIKAHITNAGGTVGSEEAPERIDLAYPIVKHLEGKNRTFASAYFGWVRFTLEGEKIGVLEEEIRTDGNVLRFLLTKLTREEEIYPFRYHEHRTSLKMVETVDEEAPVEVQTITEAETSAPVEDSVLDASLEKITGEGDNSGTAEEKKL